MKKVLLIWQLMPETVEFYLIEADENQVDVFKTANGVFINLADCSEEQTDAVNKINNALAQSDEYCWDKYKEYNCIWRDKKIQLPYEGPVDLVVTSGFLL